MTNKESINALERFIQNIYWVEPMSSEKSIKNLENALVEIKYNSGKHRGNGLLITTNGYILTVRHVVENALSNKIRYKNQNFPIIKICQTNPEEDIALIKAKIPSTPNSFEYKIKNTNSMLDEYLLGLLIEFKSKRNGKIKSTLGELHLTNKEIINGNNKYKNKYKNKLIINTKTEKGESGGILISYSGELMGFISSGTNNKTAASNIFTGLDLIQQEINILKNPLKD